jgi:hypothetical protein
VRPKSLRPIILALLLAVTSTACRSDDAVELEPPASKVPIEGTDLYRLTLTPEAVQRLDIQTTAVIENGDEFSVTSDALIVDPAGAFWVYTNPEPHTYERVKLESVREVDGEAVFSEGPEPSTPVVFVGVAELYGEETGVGK